MNLSRLSRPLGLSAAALAVGLLVGCSSVPERPVALQQAQRQHERAQADPRLAQHAAEEMRLAGLALQRAEQAHRDGQPRADVDHLAYLSSQRVALAQSAAEHRGALAQSAGAGAERDRMLMTQRTLEAERAERALVQAQQQGQRKDQQLAQADREAAAKAAQAERDAMASASRDASSQAQIGDLEQQLREMDARKTARGHVLTLGDMLFDSGQATLQPGGQARIARLAEFMLRHPNQRADIDGYTDSQGSDQSNLDLSDRRAGAVMRALVERGVAADRLSPRGQGEAMPVASNDNAAGRQANRRVEVVFLLPPSAQIVSPVSQSR